MQGHGVAARGGMAAASKPAGRSAGPPATGGRGPLRLPPPHGPPAASGRPQRVHDLPEVGPEELGRGHLHVPGHAHAVSQVLQAGGRFRPVRRCQAGGLHGRLHALRHKLGRAAQQRRGGHTQQGVDRAQQPRAGRGVGVGQARPVGVALRPVAHALAHGAAAEPRDGLVVADEAPGRLPAVVFVGDPRLGLRLRLDLPVPVDGEPGLLGAQQGPRALRLRAVAGVGLAVLRRDVHAVRVVVALRGHVVGQLLEGGEPAVHVGVAAADVEALVVERARHHALHVRGVLHVHDRRVLVGQEPRRRGVLA
mmetsp:Transcript_22076/g.68747  ORF Transcript_22076/g.68747 Transcript_22076/m.68747 type:complete len:308 (+) Transcript_22076:51-974(+)